MSDYGFNGHYFPWTASRMNGIKKYMLPDYFKSKTLLELGSGHAHVGSKFRDLGAIVTCSDAKKEHVAIINKVYPDIKTQIIDVENDSIEDHYDIILHWGLLYHLAEIETHLERVSQKCNVLLLESEVCDSNDDTFYVSQNEVGFDQAFNGKAIHPSPAYVERILKKNGFEFKRINDPILNAEFHHYDWKPLNTNTWTVGMRCFWICWKNVESPLITT